MASTIGWIFTSIVQLTMFILLVWWVAIIKLSTSVMTLVFGPEYKQSLFGKKLASTEFSLDRYKICINHGSFGTIPKVVQSAQRNLRDEMEACPDEFFFLKVRDLWFKSIATVAKFVNSDPKNIVFVANATTGINTVLRSLELHEGQAILVTNQTYGAIHKTAQEVCTSKNCNLVVLNITFPTSDLDGSAEFYVGDIIEHYRKVFENNPNIKLAIIDYITSCSAMKLPIKKLIQVCRQHKVMVLIDGAHSPGHVPLDLDSLDADFFVGNLHKWMFCPRPAAILWVHPKYQDIINPLVVSWEQDRGFQGKFFQQGTMDHTSYLVVDCALRFYQELGGIEQISGYNKSLASWASLMLATEWKTEVLPVPESMRAPFMACIRLPQEFTSKYGASHESEGLLRKDIFQQHKIVVLICCIQSSLWCRISAHVYNTKDDYVRLAKAINRMKQDLISGAFKPDIGCILDSLVSPAQSLNTLT